MRLLYPNLTHTHTLNSHILYTEVQKNLCVHRQSHKNLHQFTHFELHKP